MSLVFYIGCFLVFLTLIIFTTMNTRTKIKSIEESVSADLAHDAEAPAGFDLYESIYDFMSRQNQYIQTLA